MGTGALSERHIAFPSIPRSENAPSRQHMYSIDMKYITYLEYYSRLSQTCILNMPIIHLLSRTEQFLEVHPEYEATSQRYSVLKDHPIRQLPQSLVCLNTHPITLVIVNAFWSYKNTLTNHNLHYPFANHILLEIQGRTSREWDRVTSASKLM